jgi:sulfatase maturation enzyme AslB (radical SAM superfamily)
VTLSLDGTGHVHDYVRWPITWINYQNTVQQYQQLKQQYTNLTLEAWTVVHALNAADMPNIVGYADSTELDHSWAYLEQPLALNPRATNSYTLKAKHLLSTHTRFASIANYLATETNNQILIDNFIGKQDQLRQINIEDYLCA